MARIVAIVLNDVTRDARVCREAAALRAAGHEVHVVGLRRSADSAARETLADGTEIHRLEPPPGPFRRHDKRKKSSPTTATPLPALEEPAEAPVRPAVGAAQAVLPRWRFLLQHSGMPRLLLRDHFRRCRFERLCAAFVRTLQPDIVHAHDVDTLPIGVAAGEALGVPVVFDAHEVYDQGFVGSPFQEAHRRRCSHLLARFAGKLAGMITLTDAIAAHYTSTYPELPTPTLVPNASPRIGAVTYDGRLHAAAGFAPETRILLYQGGYATIRGLAELIAAAESLPDGWGIVTLGHGAARPRLDASCGALSARARARVRVLDAVPQQELPAWTVGAVLGYIAFPKTHLNHVLASPNRLWSYPQARVPIIGTAFVELERVRDRYGMAFTIPGKLSGEAISSLIADLDEPTLERARAGCDAFMAAESWEVHASRLVELFDRLAEPASAAATAR